MSANQMNLVYQAYGRNDILRQTLFSLISLFHVLPKTIDPKAAQNLNVIVYTDQPHFFRDFFGAEWLASGRLTLVDISPEQIKKWRGAIDFVHRVKVEVLMAAAAKFQGALFYVDGDTYFFEDPTPLFATVNRERSLMHVAEYKFSDGHDPLAKKILKFIRRHSFKVAGENVQMTPEQFMYNAGAIGIAAENTKWLPLILELTDTMFLAYGKHVIEQLAFSYYLQTRSQIVTAEDLIGHYWNQKDQFQVAIDDFLARHSTYKEAKGGYPNGFQWPKQTQATTPKFSLKTAISRLLARS